MRAVTSVQTDDVVVGRYRLGEAIGRGGVGIVFAATDEQTGERVAIKFLQHGLDDAQFVERFRREARAAARIRHPNVTRVIETGEHRGQPFTVLEYLEGRDLEAILDEHGPLDIAVAVGYAMQACEALAEAHVQGIVHRDMKPANLFLANQPDGSQLVKLVDFGISKVIDARNTEPALTIGLVGSPQYMAPEQLKQGAPIDGGCDIWGLGVTLYELLSGHSPFAVGTLPIICVSILKDEPAKLRVLRPEVPEGLEAVILKCLAKSRGDRWENVAELAEALRPFGPASLFDGPGIAMPACDPVDDIETRIALIGGRDCVLQLAIDERAMMSLPIDPRGAYLLSRLDGTSTLDDLLDISAMPTFETVRLLCELRDQSAIMPVPPAPARTLTRSG